MLQLTLSNIEKAKLRAAVADMKGTIAAQGNAPLSEGEMRRNTELCTKHFATLCKLKALLPQIKRQDQLGRDARIEFVRTIWLAGILREVKEFAFYDVFQIGDREYDLCFEMGDADQVMDAMIAKAKRSRNLNAAALEIYPQDSWNRYLKEGACAGRM
jgi:hypothetical protein